MQMDGIAETGIPFAYSHLCIYIRTCVNNHQKKNGYIRACDNGHVCRFTAAF